MKGVRKAFLICLALGAVLTAAVCALNVSRDYGWSRSICDGFFVAAVMLLGSGAIRAVNNRGAFDVAGYGLRTVINLTIPALRREEKEDIYQYRERKKASLSILYCSSLGAEINSFVVLFGGCNFHLLRLDVFFPL